MIKRQFIAGATCPGCGAMDRIQRCSDGDSTWMECVACGLVRDLDQPPVAADATDANEQTVTLKPRR